MITYAPMPLDDVLHAFAMAKAVPDPGTLEEFTRKYPAYADELTEFAVDLLLDSAIEDEADETEVGESVSPAVSRAISYFQNALYELERSRPRPSKAFRKPRTRLRIWIESVSDRWRAVCAPTIHS